MAMDFFAHQERARRQTRRMLLLFAIAVAIVVVFTDLIAWVVLPMAGINQPPWLMLALLSLGVVVVIGLGSMFRIASLNNGGSAVARGLGAREVPADTMDFTYRRLRNVVEEIAISAGVSMPEVFVLEEEAGINAFASGYTPADAAITVTRGALNKLTREELQGVIGHEFSHVLNGDMRLNIRLMGIVFGILVLSVIGRKLTWVSSRGRDRDGAAVALIGMALFVVGYIGVVCARIIKASISRQREFLADASAVQFTRQTEGIAGALKKIGGLAEGSRLEASDREEVSHMLFGDGVGYSALFATHPPLEQRIRALDPGFDPKELAAIADAWSNPRHVGDADDPNASIAGFAPQAATQPLRVAERSVALPDATTAVLLSAQSVARQVGNPGSDDRRVAQVIRQRIPAALRDAARSHEYVMPLIFALLLDHGPAVRAEQLDIIATRYESGTRFDAETLYAAMPDLHPMHRLPLASLAFPVLRRRPRAQLTTFMITLRELIGSDGETSIEEYCLARLISVQVIDALDPVRARSSGRIKLTRVESELSDLLAIVARYGHDDPALAARAYAAGMNEVLPASNRQYTPRKDWSVALDVALDRLDQLVPAGKELVVRALTSLIRSGHVPTR